MLDQRKKLVKLYKKSQKGDYEALKELSLEIERSLRKYFEKKINSEEMINELSRETYAKVLNNLPKLREPMRLKQFVLKVAYHVLHSHLRYKYQIQYADFSDANPYEQHQRVRETPERYDDEADLMLNRIDLEKSLKTLPEKTRYILQLKIDGYTYQEIAEMLDQSESAVKMQINRGYEKLKKILM